MKVTGTSEYRQGLDPKVECVGRVGTRRGQEQHVATS